MPRRLLVAALALAALLVAAAPASAAPRPWLVLSDVHFTPFAGADAALIAELQEAPVARWASILAATGDTPSAPGTDTNEALLDSALQAMRAAAPRPPVVLVAGDLLGHDFEATYAKLAPDAPPGAFESFADRTVDYLALRLGSAFPRAPFVLTLGNDDSTCGDYQLEPGGPFLRNAAEAFAPLVQRGGGAPGFEASFAALGSYATRLPRTGLHALAVADVFWSTEYRNACGRPGQRPGAALDRWLDGAVDALPRGDRAWLLTHIPPGIDVFATLDAGAGATPVRLLTPTGQRSMIGALSTGRFPAGVFGHLHMSTYRLAAGTPMLGVPSISPLFGNDPAFLTVDVERGGTIADYTAHALDLAATTPRWHREYAFGATYGLPRFDETRLAQLTAELASNRRLQRRYRHLYVSGGEDPISAEQYPAYACGSVAMSPRAYEACLPSG